MDFTPGTANHYSNFGYLLAGAVFEHVGGMAYAAYVNKTLLQPAGINEVQVISTLASLRSSNEAIVEDQGLGLSPLYLTSQLLVPSVYGGDGEINEVDDPNDGMGASAEAMTQFIHLHAGLGQRAASQRGRPRGQHAGRIHPGEVAWVTGPASSIRAIGPPPPQPPRRGVVQEHRRAAEYNDPALTLDFA